MSTANVNKTNANDDEKKQVHDLQRNALTSLIHFVQLKVIHLFLLEVIHLFHWRLGTCWRSYTCFILFVAVLITLFLLNFFITCCTNVIAALLKYCLAVYRYEKAAVISEHHSHVDSFEVMEYLQGLPSRGTLPRCTIP